jgi:hypothetical protein
MTLALNSRLAAISTCIARRKLKKDNAAITSIEPSSSQDNARSSAERVVTGRLFQRERAILWPKRDGTLVFGR